MAANFPGQSERRCGQGSHVASWRSHSAGMRKEAEGDLVKEATFDSAVRVGAPGVALRHAVLRLLVRMPADGGRIEEDHRALERGEPRAFRIPLVPADQRADLALLGVDGAEAEVPGREVELLVEGGVVRDVHL